MKHGDNFTAVINGVPCVGRVMLIQSNPEYFYLCQDELSGNNKPNPFGHKYSCSFKYGSYNYTLKDLVTTPFNNYTPATDYKETESLFDTYIKTLKEISFDTNIVAMVLNNSHPFVEENKTSPMQTSKAITKKALAGAITEAIKKGDMINPEWVADLNRLNGK